MNWHCRLVISGEQFPVIPNASSLPKIKGLNYPKDILDTRPVSVSGLMGTNHGQKNIQKHGRSQTFVDDRQDIGAEGIRQVRGLDYCSN